ncbi:MAG: choloylglycine hydrolase family protein [Chloroflexi bacterium]|nr:choloylglycine hydrolase family protein [Chloroflexota bacterium]
MKSTAIMKNRTWVGIFILLAVVGLIILTPAESTACTGIKVQNQDGSVIQARTMEFGQELIWFDMSFIPRNIEYRGNTPTQAPGMPWKVKYAHVGFSPFGIPLITDGINEKGLACGGFFQPGFAEYEAVTEKDYPRTISCQDFGSWVLGTCATTAEVREKLPGIHVCEAIMGPWKTVPPLHFVVTDETGDSIIIEYTGGKLHIYDNKIGVITNSPSYDWQIRNLRNYIGLKAENNPPIVVNGVKLEQFSQGSGSIGLPGDFTSPSRFVRAYFLLNNAYPGKDADEGIETAFRILNQFDIPHGALRNVMGDKVISDTTQWTSAADLKNRRYFFHTYDNRHVRMIDLKKLNPNAKEVKSIKVMEPGATEDITGKLEK